MKQNSESFSRRARKNEHGQVLPLVAVMMVALLGMAGFAVDVGRAYLGYRQLQAQTDAAALAGASALPQANAASVAVQYSGASGNYNAYSNLPGVSVTATPFCSTTLTNAGYPCSGPVSPAANAMRVYESVNVPTIFASLVNFHSFTITASALASDRGANGAQYNVAIITDTTSSMNNTDNDPNSGCSGTRISCALAGIQVLLQHLSPCPSKNASNCGTATGNSSGGGANVNPAFDRVSLFTFPGLTNSNEAPDEYCAGSKSTPIQIQNYNNSPVYQIVNFSSDYRSNDNTSSLNTSSDDVLAVGGSGSCSGLQVIGGVGTFYAGIINAAQAALVAFQGANPNTVNAMIILSDGDANSTAKQMGSGTYPATNECQQAVTAAQNAAAAGTQVYTIAYGTAASGTCSTDTGTYKGNACLAMENMANSPGSTPGTYYQNSQNFFSDGGQSNACSKASRGAQTVNQIFTALYGQFTNSRIIPDNTP